MNNQITHLAEAIRFIGVQTFKVTLERALHALFKSKLVENTTHQQRESIIYSLQLIGNLIHAVDDYYSLMHHKEHALAEERLQLELEQFKLNIDPDYAEQLDMLFESLIGSDWAELDAPSFRSTVYQCFHLLKRLPAVNAHASAKAAA